MNNMAITAYVSKHILIENMLEKGVTPSTVLRFMKKEIAFGTALLPTTESILSVLKDLTKLGYLSMKGKPHGADTAFVVGLRG